MDSKSISEEDNEYFAEGPQKRSKTIESKRRRFQSKGRGTAKDLVLEQRHLQELHHNGYTIVELGETDKQSLSQMKLLFQDKEKLKDLCLHYIFNTEKVVEGAKEGPALLGKRWFQIVFPCVPYLLTVVVGGDGLRTQGVLWEKNPLDPERQFVVHFRASAEVEIFSV
jgi:hypothetical protein